ncbi:MAG: ABC transporter permease, partial [Rhizobiales bacterium]|nr:ABC transporter permease [Hyphomicrobiales bacterium]
MSSAVPDPAGPASERGRWRFAFDELGILVAAVIFFAIGSLSSPYFLTLDNLTGILQSITFLGFLSIGVGLALIAGEIDISVGSIYALAAVVAALLLKNGYGVPVAFAGGLGVGLACGLVNGTVAQVINVSAVVVTLATLGVYRAITLVTAGGSPITGMPEAPLFFDGFGQGGIAGISYITILFLVVAICAEIVLRKTAFGFRLLAVGSNPVAARLVGFRVERMRIALLALSGLLAALSGVCSVAYLHTAGPTAGAGYELTVLAAAIIGGVQLSGGRGSIIGVLLGL